MYEIRHYTTALGRGKFIPGWIVIIRYVERKKEELTRDG